MITAINHITFAVHNLEESIRFYSELLGLRLVARWPKGAYLVAGSDWIALNLDPATRVGALPEYTHTAFTIAQEDFVAACVRLREAGVEFWQENRSFGDSVYFLDPNGHKLEIHSSTLPQRLDELKRTTSGEFAFYG